MSKDTEQFTFVNSDTSKPYSLVDVGPYLPDDWRDQLLQTAVDFRRDVEVMPSSTSRHDEDGPFRMGLVDGLALREAEPWIFELYHGVLKDLAGLALGAQLVAAQSDEYGVILNVLDAEKDDNYETHVDSNGATVVLGVTEHEEGGELIMSVDPEVRGYFDSLSDSAIAIPPKVGQAVIFDGTDKPHYVQLPSSGTRVTAVFNYYTSQAPEQDRPAELSHAIGLDSEVRKKGMLWHK